MTPIVSPGNARGGRTLIEPKLFEVDLSAMQRVFFREGQASGLVVDQAKLCRAALKQDAFGHCHVRHT